jgi:haloalkane dehalogenase
LVTAAEVIEHHRRAGREFEAGGVRSFVLEGSPTAEDPGTSVLLMHGVPVSSFLYRKLIAELANRSLRGVAFDLPGLGLAERPRDFDYTWTGLGRFAAAAVEAVAPDGFHLVVHDVGGPVGFELAAAMPDRVRSLTMLNTLIEVDTFKRPWFMEPFARRGVGEAWLRSLTRRANRILFVRNGIADRAAISDAEIDAHHALLKRDDGGRAFLRIMRGFERTRDKRDLYVSTVRDVPYPVQVVWGDRDPALTLSRHGEEARRAAGLDNIHTVPAKHFLQEDQAPVVAELIARLVASA